MTSLTKKQALATAPDQSVWVGASAGTGKTHVLTARVLRMMVRGTQPDHILCLTYTKAAAAEMANRIFKTLGGWAVAEDIKLSAEIADLTGEKPNDDMLARARTLFARVLEIPGGLKIQTIHSFCQSLLKRFPIEAGLSPHFTVVEERTAEELLKAAASDVMDAAGDDDSDPLARAFTHMAINAGEFGFSGALKSFLGMRRRILALLAEFGEDGLMAEVYKTLGVDQETSEQDILAKALSDKALDRSGLTAMIPVLLSGSVSEKPKGKALKAFFEDPENRLANYAAYREVFLTKEGEPRARVLTKKTADAHPAFLDVIAIETKRLLSLEETLKLTRVADNTAALIRLGRAILYLYQHKKRVRGFMDYDDLILETARLLDREGIAPWILYKLDGGIDHILVDEAQDTSHIQWQLVETLSSEFFAGLGTRDEVIRTVFAVGDKKQSIYRFQGADPEQFSAAKLRIRKRAEAAGLTLEDCALTLSFRSTEAVLEVVDAVFAGSEVRDGVAEEEEIIRHEAERIGQGGVVEIWSPETPGDKEQQEAGWQLPLEQKFPYKPEAALAKRIADHIGGMIADGEKLPARGRKIRFGDIMVLVRQRGPFMDHLIRDLKSLGIPVAGSDRLKLGEHIAVQDLIMAARFALLPEDDFTLACVLKSPLIGFDDDDLMALAIGRSGTLWQSLNVASGKKFEAARSLLSQLLARADYITPFGFFMDILGPMGGRKLFVRRLGHEVHDPLDEFVSLAQRYQLDETASLQGFLKWFAASETEIKRDMERGLDEVRILTIHGAKGLQAPIVYLPDTFQGPKSRSSDLLDVGQGIPVWPGRKDNEAGPVALARQNLQAENQAEDNRLLYVALTRAEDRLYICGWQGKNQSKTKPWYHHIFDAVNNMEGVDRLVDDQGRETLRYHKPHTGGTRKEEKLSAASLGPVDVPAWALEVVGKQEQSIEALQPSKAEGGLSSRPGEAAGGKERAIQRGTIIHKLLEVLPGLDAKDRREKARSYLKRKAFDLAEKEQQEILERVMAVLEHPDFERLFGPGSSSEVGLLGEVDGKRLTGRVDRMVVYENEVHVIDYKSDRNVPRNLEDVPDYVAQLRLYAALVRGVYPGKIVTASLLFIEDGTVLAIPQEMLNDRVS